MKSGAAFGTRCRSSTPPPPDPGCAGRGDRSRSGDAADLPAGDAGDRHAERQTDGGRPRTPSEPPYNAVRSIAVRSVGTPRGCRAGPAVPSRTHRAVSDPIAVRTMPTTLATRRTRRRRRTVSWCRRAGSWRCPGRRRRAEPVCGAGALPLVERSARKGSCGVHTSDTAARATSRPSTTTAKTPVGRGEGDDGSRGGLRCRGSSVRCTTSTAKPTSSTSPVSTRSSDCPFVTSRRPHVGDEHPWPTRAARTAARPRRRRRGVRRSAPRAPRARSARPRAARAGGAPASGEPDRRRGPDVVGVEDAEASPNG